jgi:plasmid stability protein
LAPKWNQDSLWLHIAAKPVPHLSIKDVPEEWAEVLRHRAARHHRSLQGELMAILEQAVREPIPEPAVAGEIAHRFVAYDDRGWPITRLGTKQPEELFAEMRRAGTPVIPGQPSSVDIIRAERDKKK